MLESTIQLLEGVEAARMANIKLPVTGHCQICNEFIKINCSSHYFDKHQKGVPDAQSRTTE